MNRDAVALIVWSLFMIVLYLTPGPNYWADVLDGSAPTNQTKSIAGEQASINAASADGSASLEKRLHRSETEEQMSVSRTPGSTKGDTNTAKDIARSIVTENLGMKERLAHGLPMIAFAFCLVRIFRHRERSRGYALVGAILLSGLFSLTIECVQELLPESFAHGFAVSDILASLLGGALGACVALLVPARVLSKSVR